jgi:8-oxo-dGTP pyrophosphatase MutT (NUDIX family)
MSLLDRIDECNAHDLTNFLPFYVAGARVGWIKKPFVRRLAGFDAFSVSSDAVEMDSGLTTPEARSEAMAEAIATLAKEGAVTGIRGEMYRVSTSFGAPPLLVMERAAAPHFGVRAYGVHLTGYVRDPDGGTRIWVGLRDPNKHAYPGQLDNLVAGGQPVGLGLAENLAKEAREEASIPPELIARARPVGCISYCQEVDEGLKPDVLFCYDLELPADFVPVNTDGEVVEFYLWPVEKAMHVIASTREFKFNCNLVNIDFFVRHGFVAPDDPDYVAILRGLHS